MDDFKNACLLCQIAEANKTNSHIVPKFLVKSMLGTEKRKAFLLNTDKLAFDTPFSQDTDKIDYLFCEDCETYFSVLETYFASRIHNRIKDVRYKSQFSDFNSKALQWKICKEVNPIAFKLFIYSIIFRCSVANEGIFQKFTLKDSELKILKDFLLHFKDIKQENVLKKIEDSKIDNIDLKFAIITSDSFLDATKNSVGIHPGHGKNDCYCFLLNEYYLYFSFEDLIINQEIRFENITNSKTNNEVKIGFMSNKQWEAMENGLLSIVVRTGINKTTEKGELQQLFDRLNKKYPSI